MSSIVSFDGANDIEEVNRRRLVLSDGDCVEKCSITKTALHLSNYL